MFRKNAESVYEVTADKTHIPMKITNSQYSITIHLNTTLQVSQLLPHLVYFTINCICCFTAYILFTTLFHNTPIYKLINLLLLLLDKLYHSTIIVYQSQCTLLWFATSNNRFH